MEKQRAPRNQTLTIDDREKDNLQNRFIAATKAMSVSDIINKTFNNDLFAAIDFFPEKSVDLLVIDPPYNLDKDFNGYKFNKSDDDAYINYLESWFPKVIRLLKQNGSLYICGDWKCTSALYRVVSKYLTVRNRITWQREKGRGAKSNWKNCTEDIWFATVSDDYYFDVDSVKMKRKVIAPYKENGKPKDWEETEDGNFRLTHPSNFWDDITIPYWSMPENTDHPTQKPEKLIAKLILASCPVGGLVFDPFLGSGTTSVVAKKLNRNYCGIELNNEYCCWTEKRLEQASEDNSIQGYSDGLFWERNTLNLQKENGKKTPKTSSLELSLFEAGK
jgi:site-specific DNA-methyltransferase (adenine-specific)